MRAMETFMLTLVRHGETTENKLKIVQGHKDTKLDEVGLTQAGLVGERLKDELFTHVFSSDLSRAYQTCEVIMNCNRVKRVPIISDSRLRERKLGELEGQPQKNCYDFMKSNSRCQGVGMETKTEVRERAKSFFRELCRTIRKQEPNRQQKDGDCFNKTSTNNCTLHAPCRHADCKFCSSSSSSPSTTSILGSEDCPGRELILCNLRGITDNNGTSNHLKDEAAMLEASAEAATKLENCMDKMKLSLESSSDEEHLGITSEMLQLGGSNTDRPTALHRAAAAQPLSGISEGYSDDDDPNDRMAPVNNDGSEHLANVLVVSHGGFLVELINYFFKELKCEKVQDDLPSLQLQCESSAAPSLNANRNSIMSNAGLSKFSVALKDTGKPKKISCLFLNDRKHLLDADTLTHPACTVPEDLPC